MGSGLQSAGTISKFTKWMVIAIISTGAVTVYLTYLARYSFYDQVIDGLQISNSQLGVLYGLYGTTATIAYFFGGVLADKIRVKYLTTLGFAMSAALTFWYSTTPSYGELKVIFLLFGLCTTLIFWGVRYKAIRLVSTEQNYSTAIGFSYGIVGVVGLVVNFIAISIFGAFASAQVGFQTVLMFYAGINVVFAVLSFLFIPKFKEEFAEERQKFNLNELVQALKHPGRMADDAVHVLRVYDLHLAGLYGILPDGHRSCGRHRVCHRNDPDLWHQPFLVPDCGRNCRKKDAVQDHLRLHGDYGRFPGRYGIRSQGAGIHHSCGHPDYPAVLLPERSVWCDLIHDDRDQGAGGNLRFRVGYSLGDRLYSGYVCLSGGRQMAGYLRYGRSLHEDLWRAGSQRGRSDYLRSAGEGLQEETAGESGGRK